MAQRPALRLRHKFVQIRLVMSAVVIDKQRHHRVEFRAFKLRSEIPGRWRWKARQAAALKARKLLVGVQPGRAESDKRKRHDAAQGPWPQAGARLRRLRSLHHAEAQQQDKQPEMHEGLVKRIFQIQMHQQRHYQQREGRCLAPVPPGVFQHQ